jgi:hypothetical protein
MKEEKKPEGTRTQVIDPKEVIKLDDDEFGKF